MEKQGRYAKRVLDSYFETMFWAEKPDDEDEAYLDHVWQVDNLAGESLTESEKEVEAFIKRAEAKGIDFSKYRPEQIGHDFWLTRQGHGAGFWDGDYPKDDGDTLTAVSKSFREVCPYSGDDKKIYL